MRRWCFVVVKTVGCPCNVLCSKTLQLYDIVVILRTLWDPVMNQQYPLQIWVPSSDSWTLVNFESEHGMSGVKQHCTRYCYGYVIVILMLNMALSCWFFNHLNFSLNLWKDHIWKDHAYVLLAFCIQTYAHVILHIYSHHMRQDFLKPFRDEISQEKCWQLSGHSRSREVSVCHNSARQPRNPGSKALDVWLGGKGIWEWWQLDIMAWFTEHSSDVHSCASSRFPRVVKCWSGSFVMHQQLASALQGLAWHNFFSVYCINMISLDKSRRLY